MYFKVGDPLVRVDSAAKVTGQASYAADLAMPGILYGKALRSPFAHARIKSLNVEKARALSGVRAVVTGSDFPHLHGECIINIPFLAIDKVRYVGDPVVAVAAEDLATAEEALDRVEVEYEELPALFDPEEALKPEAPLIHEDLGKYQSISAVTVVPGTNICQHFVLNLGDVEKGFLQSDYIFEDRFVAPQAQHAAIEPHGCIARVDATGRITVWGQNDSPHRARKEIAQGLGIPQSKVRVVTGYVGGNFGGKGGVKPEAIAIALASRTRGRPVKVIFSREEVFKTITRSGCVMYLKTGVRKDGTLLARDMRFVWDMGAYAEKGPTISLNASTLASGPYAIPHTRVESFSVFTNKPMAGAMRGYGVPQVAFAYESQMDIIAEKLGMSPFEFRMKNAADEGTPTVTGQRLYAVGIKECLERVGRELYNKPGPVADSGKGLGYGRWVKGKGLACIMKSTKTPTVSAAYVKIDEDGSGSVVTSTVEVGQGAHTVLVQIAGDILGLDAERLTVSFADTDVTPYDTSTTASRSTFHMGNAVRMAAEDAKRQLLAMAAPLLKSERETLKLHEGSVWSADGRSLTIAQVLKSAFGAGAGAAILGKGVYNSANDVLGLEDMGDMKMEAYSSMAVFHSYAALGAEVAVDLETGMVKVLRFVAAHDVGKAINPVTCRQQIEGALSMGLGYGLMEEYLWENGKVLNADFLNYAIPTALDCPPAEIYLVEKRHPQGPYGAKGMGEMANAHVAPAIANAVSNACGVRIYDLPLKPAKILRALRAQEGRVGETGSRTC